MMSQHPARFFLIGGVILLILSDATFASSATGRNVLANPGFETGFLAPWFQDRVVVDEGSDWTVTNSDWTSGNYSAWVDDNKELRQNFSAVRGSDIREISFWGKHTENGARDVFVEVFFSDGTLFNNNSTFQTTYGEWSKIDATSYVNSTKFVTGVSVFGNTSSPFFLDDFVVSVVPEPSTIMSVASGLTVVLVASRWRWRASHLPSGPRSLSGTDSTCIMLDRMGA